MLDIIWTNGQNVQNTLYEVKSALTSKIIKSVVKKRLLIKMGELIWTFIPKKDLEPTEMSMSVVSVITLYK